MKNKFFNFALMLCLIIPCMFVFCGCGPTANFTAQENIKESAQAIVDDIATNLYNNTAVYGTSTQYSVAQIKQKDTDFNYWVKIGAIENFDAVDSITINGTKFTKAQKFELSFGKNNKINDLCYYVDEGDLYVAAPIIAFETVNGTKIKVNDVEFDFNLNTTATAGAIISVAFQDSSNTAETNYNEYNLTFNNANKYLAFEYAEATANDIILTKKVMSGSDNPEKNTVSYGITKTDVAGGKNILGLYPIGWSSSALTQQYVTNFDGAKMDYSFYVNGKVYQAVLNFTINLPA